MSFDVRKIWIFMPVFREGDLKRTGGYVKQGLQGI
jgi:hypothetical protein